MILFILFNAEIPVQAASVNCEWTGSFAWKLSEYNLFAVPVKQIPNDGLVLYDIMTPLFSDYAHKSRFIYLPEGGVINYSETTAFAFPVGSMLVKTFFYPVDFRDPDGPRRLIETRLLVHTKDKGWTGAAYVWNSEQSDAALMVAGHRLPIEWIHYNGSKRSTRYRI